MTKNYSWKHYNNSIKKLVLYNIDFNKRNKFNAPEKNYYPQTRDIFSITAITGNSKKILDFGSNLSMISNLRNKLELNNKEFIIYNPFFDNNFKPKIKNIKYKVVNNLEKINKIKFDLVHFGSCIQYIKNFYELFEKIKFEQKSKILFTATPFNLHSSYFAKQTNKKNLEQFVHDYEFFKKFLNEKNFNLIFKSSIDIKLAKLKPIKSGTYFLNLLFQKK